MRWLTKITSSRSAEPGTGRGCGGHARGSGLIWSPDNTGPFRGAVVLRLVSDGERAIVLGWDRGSETPLWWQRAGLSWQRHQLPDAFGTFPRDAAGGPLGIVAIGQVTSESGRTPVFWRLGAGVQWEQEPSPVMPAPATAMQARSPRPPWLLVLDTALAAGCFGDEPITVRGWSALCEGCYGESAGTWETEWLAQPGDDRLLHLAPFESGDWGSVDVLHPTLRRTPPSSRWLEVTGHFDDPEASSCRWTPTVIDEMWYSGTEEIVAGCRGVSWSPRSVRSTGHESSEPDDCSSGSALLCAARGRIGLASGAEALAAVDRLRAGRPERDAGLATAASQVAVNISRWP